MSEVTKPDYIINSKNEYNTVDLMVQGTSITGLDTCFADGSTAKVYTGVQLDVYMLVNGSWVKI